MGQGLVKLNDGTRDWYLIWSTVVDAPVTSGMSLEELREHIRETSGSDGLAELPERLERCDRTGTSFLDDTLEGLLCCNRAGPRESQATAEDILRIYCHEPARSSSRGSR